MNSGNEERADPAVLERIETGEYDVERSRDLLRRVIADHRDDDGASEVYCCLRSKVGRLLRTTSTSRELRRWHALIKATAAQFRGELRDHSIRIDVLADLVHERVGEAESHAWSAASSAIDPGRAA